MARKKRLKFEEPENTPSEPFSVVTVAVAVTASLAGIPLEIKLMILEMLALESRGSLAIVCQLSREWQSIAMPLLYQIVTIWTTVGLHVLAETVQSGRRPSSFYKTTVKTVCIACSISDKASLPELDAVLAACRDITTLAVRKSGCSLATIIARHCTKLQKLCIPEGSLWDSKYKGLNTRIAALFKKTQITHLRVEAGLGPPSTKIDFGSLPLTHLHIHLPMFFNFNFFTPSKMFNMVQQTFTLPSSLKFCILSGVIMDGTSGSSPQIRDAIASVYAQQPSFVFIACHSPTNGGSGTKWYIPDLVPLISASEEAWAQDWTNRRVEEEENIWEIAERLVTPRGVQKVMSV